MVKVENRYILSEGDKSLSLCFVDELSNEKTNVDAIIYTNDKETSLRNLIHVCNIDGIIHFKFRDLYDVFHDSGKWYYSEHSYNVNEINKSSLYTSYENMKACFVVFKVGRNVGLNNTDDILENIRKSREQIEIAFGCIIDETFEPDRIDMFVYRR